MIQDTHQKALKLSDLFAHFGAPISEDVAQQAVRLMREAARLGFANTEARPGLSQSVVISIYHGARYFELAVQTDRSVDFVLELNGRKVQCETGLSFEQAESKLEWASRREGPLSFANHSQPPPA